MNGGGWTDYAHMSGFVPWTWLVVEPTANPHYKPAFAFFWQIRPGRSEAPEWVAPEPLDRPLCPLSSLPMCAFDGDYWCLSCEVWHEIEVAA